nr:uncharacterized protein LOC111427417 [Onthophagus taurus]
MSLWNRLRLGVLCCIITRATLLHALNQTDELPHREENGDIWRFLVKNCDQDTTVSCLKKTVYDYLDHTMDYNGSIEIFSGVKLLKNNASYDASNEIEDSREIKDSFEDITEALRSRAVKFAMTHDIMLPLPETLFGGGSINISPRTFEGDGALIKLDAVPAQGRIFFKKIKKFITNRLLFALLAIVLVIKLVAVKFLFFLPLVMGVAAAKKLFLKILLFFFPLLSHVFKLCPYYSPTKLHHHQHHISHIHHLSHLHSDPHGIELDHPPPGYGHDAEFEHDHHNHHSDHQFDYYADGASGADYRRKVFEKGKPADDSWFGGQGQASVKRGTRVKPLTPAEIENMIRQAEKEATLKARLQEEQKRVEADNKRLQDQIKQLMKVQEKLRLQQTILKENSKLTAANILHTANIIPQNQLVHTVAAQIPPPYIQPPIVGAVPVYQTSYQSNLQAVTAAPPTTSSTSTTKSPVYDAFYSPILEKIDKVLLDIGFNDEPCRERLICSMYKDPVKFSPHSNLISAELSRDADELQKPTATNPAVIRFYKYVQAARDGQDQRDCLRLYPSCAVNTES